MVSDDDLVAAAGDAARNTQDGYPVSPAVLSLMRAIALTRDEQHRRSLADAAAIRAGELGATALQVLRVAIFALA